jgi:thioredoxin-like negative regulator of GroEL
MLVIVLSCNSFKKSNIENKIPENNINDDYALLREPGNESHKIVEDLSGNVIILTEKEFIERITDLDNPKGFQYKGNTPCIVELYANWCKPCGYLSQLFNELAPEYQGRVIFYKIDMDKAREIQLAFNVKTIPKILYFKPRGEISNTIGYLNKEELKKMIDELLLKP